MVLSSRGWVPFGVLVVAAVVTTAFVLVALDGATQAEFAAASANTTTSAEPALPLWTPAAAGIIALVVGSVVAWASGAEED